MTGTVMWEHHSGHLKNNGLLLVVALLLLPFHRGPLLRFVLVLNAAVGLNDALEWPVVKPGWYSPNWAEYHFRPTEPEGPLMTRVGEDFRCSVQRIGEPEGELYDGLWEWCHRPLRHFRVRVTNGSSVTWHRYPERGPNSLNLLWQLTDRDGLIRHQGRLPLPRTVAPGESVEMKIGVRIPAGSGKYVLHASVWQEGNRFFDQDRPEFGLTEVLRVD
jgi:hypothetical protein